MEGHFRLSKNNTYIRISFWIIFLVIISNFLDGSQARHMSRAREQTGNTATNSVSNTRISNRNTRISNTNTRISNANTRIRSGSQSTDTGRSNGRTQGSTDRRRSGQLSQRCLPGQRCDQTGSRGSSRSTVLGSPTSVVRSQGRTVQNSRTRTIPRSRGVVSSSAQTSRGVVSSSAQTSRGVVSSSVQTSRGVGVDGSSSRGSPRTSSSRTSSRTLSRTSSRGSSGVSSRGSSRSTSRLSSRGTPVASSRTSNRQAGTPRTNVASRSGVSRTNARRRTSTRIRAIPNNEVASRTRTRGRNTSTNDVGVNGLPSGINQFLNGLRSSIPGSVGIGLGMSLPGQRGRNNVQASGGAPTRQNTANSQRGGVNQQRNTGRQQSRVRSPQRNAAIDRSRTVGSNSRSNQGGLGTFVPLDALSGNPDSLSFGNDQMGLQDMLVGSQVDSSVGIGPIINRNDRFSQVSLNTNQQVPLNTNQQISRNTNQRLAVNSNQGIIQPGGRFIQSQGNQNFQGQQGQLSHSQGFQASPISNQEQIRFGTQQTNLRSGNVIGPDPAINSQRIVMDMQRTQTQAQTNPNVGIRQNVLNTASMQSQGQFANNQIQGQFGSVQNLPGTIVNENQFIQGIQQSHSPSNNNIQGQTLFESQMPLQQSQGQLPVQQGQTLLASQIPLQQSQGQLPVQQGQTLMQGLAIGSNLQGQVQQNQPLILNSNQGIIQPAIGVNTMQVPQPSGMATVNAQIPIQQTVGNVQQSIPIQAVGGINQNQFSSVITDRQQGLPIHRETVIQNQVPIQQQTEGQFINAPLDGSNLKTTAFQNNMQTSGIIQPIQNGNAVVNGQVIGNLSPNQLGGTVNELINTQGQPLQHSSAVQTMTMTSNNQNIPVNNQQAISNTANQQVINTIGGQVLNSNQQIQQGHQFSNIVSSLSGAIQNHGQVNVQPTSSIGGQVLNNVNQAQALNQLNQILGAHQVQTVQSNPSVNVSSVGTLGGQTFQGIIPNSPVQNSHVNQAGSITNPTVGGPTTQANAKRMLIQIDPNSRGVKIVPDGMGGVKVISLREAVTISPFGTENTTQNSNTTPQVPIGPPTDVPEEYEAPNGTSYDWTLPNAGLDAGATTPPTAAFIQGITMVTPNIATPSLVVSTTEPAPITTQVSEEEEEENNGSSPSSEVIVADPFYGGGRQSLVQHTNIIQDLINQLAAIEYAKKYQEALALQKHKDAQLIQAQHNDTLMMEQLLHELIKLENSQNVVSTTPSSFNSATKSSPAATFDRTMNLWERFTRSTTKSPGSTTVADATNTTSVNDTAKELSIEDIYNTLKKFPNSQDILKRLSDILANNKTETNTSQRPIHGGYKELYNQSSSSVSKSRNRWRFHSRYGSSTTKMTPTSSSKPANIKISTENIRRNTLTDHTTLSPIIQTQKRVDHNRIPADMKLTASNGMVSYTDELTGSLNKFNKPLRKNASLNRRVGSKSKVQPVTTSTPLTTTATTPATTATPGLEYVSYHDNNVIYEHETHTMTPHHFDNQMDLSISLTTVSHFGENTAVFSGKDLGGSHVAVYGTQERHHVRGHNAFPTNDFESVTGNVNQQHEQMHHYETYPHLNEHNHRQSPSYNIIHKTTTPSKVNHRTETTHVHHTTTKSPTVTTAGHRFDAGSWNFNNTAVHVHTKNSTLPRQINNKDIPKKPIDNVKRIEPNLATILSKSPSGMQIKQLPRTKRTSSSFSTNA